MVVFTCDLCNDSIKKTKVALHFMQCRGCRVVSCMDCGKSFDRETFKDHNTCVSEAQKYQGHLYQEKEKGNKGEAKQQQWTELLQQVQTSDPKLKVYLEQLSSFSNIPRKQAKFINFARNSLKLHNAKILQDLWTLFDAVKPKAYAYSRHTSLFSSVVPEKKEEVAELPAAEPVVVAEPAAAAEDDDSGAEKKKKSKKKKSEKEEKEEPKEETKPVAEAAHVESEDGEKKKKKKKSKEASVEAASAPAPAEPASKAKRDAEDNSEERHKSKKSKKGEDFATSALPSLVAELSAPSADAMVTDATEKKKKKKEILYIVK